MKRIVIVLALLSLVLSSGTLAQIGRSIRTQRIRTDTLNYGQTLPYGAIKDSISAHRTAITFAGDYVNAKATGAIGDGGYDDRAAIQRAIDVVAAAGGGVAYLPPGYYRIVPVSGHGSELASGILYGLRPRSNVHLRGAGPGATHIVLDANNYTWTNIIQNYNSQYGEGDPLDSNIVISDLSVDGNAAVNVHTGQDTANYGIVFSNVKYGLIRNVRVEGISGVGSSGPQEAFAVAVSFSKAVTVENAELIGNPNSSSGLAVTASMAVSVSNVRAHDFGVANGISVYESQKVTISNCITWGNAVSGINAELSGDVVISNCASGGRQPDFTTPIFTSGALTPNNIGFSVLYTKGPTWIVGCTGTYNTTVGFQSSAGDDIHIVGGTWSNNGLWGILMSNFTDSTTNSISGDPRIENNGETGNSGVWFGGRTFTGNPVAGPLYIGIGTDSIHTFSNTHIKGTIWVDSVFTLLDGGTIGDVGNPRNTYVTLQSDSAYVAYLMWGNQGGQQWHINNYQGHLNFVRTATNSLPEETPLRLMSTGGALLTGNLQVTEDVVAANSVSATWSHSAFAASTRVAIYLPGTESTDLFVVSWHPAADITFFAGGKIWAFTKTDSLIVRCDSTSSTQFTYIGLK